MRDALVERLTLQCGYSPAGAASMADKCAHMPEAMQRLVQDWIDTGRETELTCEGYSVQGLMRERGFSYVNALNVIWWLERDPQAAKKALGRPVDRIVRSKRND